MLRFANFALFLLAVCLYFFFPNNKITQETLDLFPQNDNRRIIDIYNKFADSKYIFVAIKGFDSKARAKLDEFLSKAEKLENIEKILTKKQATKELRDFIKDNYFYVANAESKQVKKLDSKEIQKTILQNLESLNKSIQDSKNSGDSAKSKIESKTDSKDKLDSNSTHTKSHIASDSSSSVDTADIDIDSLDPEKVEEIIIRSRFNPLDPLKIFSMPSEESGYLVAKNYGYGSLVEMKSLEQPKVMQTLESFKKIASDYPDIRYFSQNFMSVENMSLILKEVGFLLTFSTVIFVVLYFVIIRIPMLTINTICTLVVANIIAIFVVSYVYPKVTIMALSFGMGISNIAIDYMMHHNFFGLYATKKIKNIGKSYVTRADFKTRHDPKRTDIIFNKPVFYGYITTIIGFGVCLFIPFPLLTQLSLYAIISLSFCYVSFAFLYPRIGFAPPRLFLKLASLRYPVISSHWFFLVACGMFILTFFHLKPDFDLSKLDYQNTKMLKERDFFMTSFSENESQILLSSSNLESLIKLTKILQNRMKALDSKIIIPLSILPTQEQITQNKTLLESKNMIENKKTMLKTLPHLKEKILKKIMTSGDSKNQQDFENKKDFIDNIFELFEEAYELDSPPKLDLDSINKMGIAVIEDSKTFYYLANIPTQYIYAAQDLAKDIESNSNNLNWHIDTRGVKTIMNHITDGVYMPMLVILVVTLIIMICTVFITAKGSPLGSLVFILFPLSIALGVISTHSELNIMHLFALLILVVVSIDYGIYSIVEGDNPRTSHAIFFSAITTGISFGILITSKTKALNSFGEVIFVGMICVLFMLVFHRVKRKVRLKK